MKKATRNTLYSASFDFFFPTLTSFKRIIKLIPVVFCRHFVFLVQQVQGKLMGSNKKELIWSYLWVNVSFLLVFLLLLLYHMLVFNILSVLNGKWIKKILIGFVFLIKSITCRIEMNGIKLFLTISHSVEPQVLIKQAGLRLQEHVSWFINMISCQCWNFHRIKSAE